MNSNFSVAPYWSVMTNACAVRLLRGSVFNLLLAEISALFSKDSREFITLSGAKNNEKK